MQENLPSSLENAVHVVNDSRLASFHFYIACRRNKRLVFFVLYVLYLVSLCIYLYISPWRAMDRPLSENLCVSSKRADSESGLFSRPLKAHVETYNRFLSP